MKRRDFLKLGIGAGAVVAVPSLAEATPKQLNFKAYPVRLPLDEVMPNIGLAPLKPEGAKVAYDLGAEHPPQTMVIDMQTMKVLEVL